MARTQTTLIFPGTAQDVAEFWASVFGDDAEILQVGPISPEGTPYPGVPIVVEIRVLNTELMLMNGPAPEHTVAAALQVYVADQAELDRYWDGLAAGGTEEPGGWLTDKYGFHWNFVPQAFLDGMSSGNSQLVGAVTQEMWKPQKPDVDAIEALVKDVLG